ncbi:His-Xaa-Ser system protein HxsD [Hahella sp. CCB-MM4]|uniref:His-Xaa-Ser system protein HxsD n=1 Tax=Hahella sp. (strain CCB-MM4) TaxID=1926491 RepID=UPI000B9C4BCA|nr:His-Xaa-Ser system protein HxsD [Hahella sp. CCB-MM4]OZG70866.1 His-Xaa-Ser system protein HxsD [Hahella sp. CCB-MM4]
MEIRELQKSDYTEWVIRNTLYWLTPYSRWQLSDSSTHWIIQFESPSNDLFYELDKLLNDYTLRENVMEKTSTIREAITLNVLKSIQQRLEA